MKAKFILLFIFFSMFGFKVYSILHNPNFNPKDETALFWTESALQYRTAKIVANYGFIPSLDEKLQYPEGLHIEDRLTVLMETISGYTYRFFIPKAVPFHVFLVIFISFCSSLSIFPLYFSLRLISKKTETGLMAVALYAVTPAVYTTVTAPGYELQDFALPLIFFHIYFFARALKARDRLMYSYSFLSAAFLFSALAAWHLTQFYYILLVIFVIICFLSVKDFAMKPFYIVTALNIGAGLIIPPLRTVGFIISLSMLMSYSLIIASVVPERLVAQRRFLFLLLLFASLLITAYISFVSIPEYRFVYGLVLDKVRYLGIRPTDPTKLPWESLVMWVSPFTSPSFSIITRTIGTILLTGLLGVLITISMLLRKSTHLVDVLFLFLTAAFGLFYLLLIRLDAFLVWFLAFHTGRLSVYTKRIGLVFVLVCIGVNGFLLIRGSQRAVAPTQNYLLGMIKYIRYNTPQDASILTSFAYGPSIITYTGRPVHLHPKFEAEGIGSKIKEFEHRLYEDENLFYAFCRLHKARYFVYQTDMLLARGPESIRYRTHNLTLSQNCATFKFHFRPDSLKFFELVYSNPHYRVYRVMEQGERPQHITRTYFRVFDEQLFDMNYFGIF